MSKAMMYKFLFQNALLWWVVTSNAADAGKQEALVSRLNKLGALTHWDEVGRGYSISINGVLSHEAETAKLMNELGKYGPIIEFYATAGMRSPSAKFFESLHGMKDVKSFAVAYISDPNVLKALGVFENARYIELLEVSAKTDEFPKFGKCEKLNYKSPLSNKAVRSLSKLNRIRSLSFWIAPDATIQGVESLKAMASLRELYLGIPESVPLEFSDPMVREKISHAMPETVKVTFLDPP